MHILFTCRRASGVQKVVMTCGWDRRDGDPRTEVVEGIEDDAKGLEPVDVELGFLDVGVDRVNVDIGVKSGRGLSCYL